MALSCLRLRRVHPVSSSLLRCLRSPLHSTSKGLFDPPSASTAISLPLVDGVPNQNLNHQQPKSFVLASQSLPLRSSRYFSTRIPIRDDGKIGPDTILFEGCDYNHWLITVDFPKDPKPTSEEMVETYVQTAAKVFGSVEEAKKRIYACSTTTYNGFQVECSEETSEKFRGLPGVVFILPDSYIDPVNKEYGGDKYINGTIIPRPPPVHYGRSSRYNDRNRNYDRPRYDRQREPMQMQQQGPGQFERSGPPPFDRQNTMLGGRQDHPTPPPPPPQTNFSPGSDFQNPAQGGGQHYPPPPQGNFVPGGYQQNTMQSGGHGYPPPPPPRNFAAGGFQQNSTQGGYGPPMGRDYPPPGNRGFPQGETGDNRFAQGEQRDPLPPYGRGQGNYGPPERRDFSQGERRDYPPQQRDFGRMDQRQNSGQVNYGQVAGSGYSSTGEGYPQPRGQGASGMGYGNAMPGEPRTSNAGGQSEYGQGWR